MGASHEEGQPAAAHGGHRPRAGDVFRAPAGALSDRDSPGTDPAADHDTQAADRKRAPSMPQSRNVALAWLATGLALMLAGPAAPAVHAEETVCTWQPRGDHGGQPARCPRALAAPWTAPGCSAR